MPHKGFKFHKGVVGVSNEDYNSDEEYVTLSEILSKPVFQKKEILDDLLSDTQNFKASIYGSKNKTEKEIRRIRRSILEEDLFYDSEDEYPDGEPDNNEAMRMAPKTSHNHFQVIKDSLQSSYNQEHKLDPTVPKNTSAFSGLSIVDGNNLFTPRTLGATRKE